MTHLKIVLFVILGISSCTVNGQTDSLPKQESATLKASKQDASHAINFASLVASLKNANPKPRIVGGWDMRFAQDYDFSEQRRIHKAIRTLMIYAEESWPYLVANIANEEYSYTFGYGGSSKNYTVGRVCERIIRNALSCGYDRFAVLLVDTNIRMEDLEDPAIRDRDKLRIWLEERRSVPLVDLQILILRTLSERFKAFNVSEDKKMRFLEIIAEVTANLKRRGYPELAEELIPNRETWMYLSKDDAEK